MLIAASQADKCRSSPLCGHGGASAGLSSADVQAKRALYSRYSEFRNIPSCRSASALGADGFRSVQLIGSEYSALPIWPRR